MLGGDAVALGAGSGVLVLAGEEAAVEASSTLALLRVTVGPNADRHAPLGPREAVVHLALPGSEAATGARSFQILFGPHNGSTRATLFAGFIPPERRPGTTTCTTRSSGYPKGRGVSTWTKAREELGAGSAFRLRPRQVHIVENPSPDREITIIGVFTPAGSPSAAYLTPHVAASYRFGG